jgi:hypothetical protein
VNESERQLTLEFKDLKAAEALERLEEGAAAAAPSDEHAYVLARLCPEKEDADKWLDLAVKEDLTAAELQRSIKAGSVVKDDSAPRINANDKSAGIVSIEGIAGQFDLWFKKVEEEGFPTKWDARRLKMVWSLLRPFSQIFTAVDDVLQEQNDKQQGNFTNEELEAARELHKKDPRKFSVATVQRVFKKGYHAGCMLHDEVIDLAGGES